MRSRARWRDFSCLAGVVRAVGRKDSPMRLIDAIHENRLLSRWAALLPRPPSSIGSIHEADAELVPLDATRWLAMKADTVAEEIAAGLYVDPPTAGRIAVISVL